MQNLRTSREQNVNYVFLVINQLILTRALRARPTANASRRQGKHGTKPPVLPTGGFVLQGSQSQPATPSEVYTRLSRIELTSTTSRR
jgi:hypothetical protein